MLENAPPYESDVPISVPVTRCPACGGINVGIRFCIDCGGSVRSLPTDDGAR